MDKYKDLNPHYKSRYASDKNLVKTEVYQVDIENKPKFVIKSLKTSETKDFLESFLKKEYVITSLLSMISPYTGKIIDIHISDSPQNIIEILIEYTGINLLKLTSINYETLIEMVYQLRSEEHTSEIQSHS